MVMGDGPGLHCMDCFMDFMKIGGWSIRAGFGLLGILSVMNLPAERNKYGLMDAKDLDLDLPRSNSYIFQTRKG